MAVAAEDFQAVLTTLVQLLPMQRQLDPAALVMAWDTWPGAAKAQVSAEMLRFAAGQRHMDPAPPRELALHMALLRYLFPLENDRAVVDRGLRSDLAERMAQSDRFHDPAPTRQEHQAPPSRPQLPGRGNGFWHPNQLTPEQRRAHVQGVGARLELLLSAGQDGRGWSASQLAQGRWWLGRALEGFWPLQCDDGGIVAAWAVRNESLARQMVADALTGAAPALPPAEAVSAGAILGGLGGEAASW